MTPQEKYPVGAYVIYEHYYQGKHKIKGVVTGHSDYGPIIDLTLKENNHLVTVMSSGGFSKNWTPPWSLIDIHVSIVLPLTEDELIAEYSIS